MPLKFSRQLVLSVMVGLVLVGVDWALFGAHAPYLAKPVTEASLASLGFLSSRFYTYR